jgi:hypothetical protein
MATLITVFRDNKPAIKLIQLKYSLDLDLPREGEEVPDMAMMTTGRSGHNAKSAYAVR